MVKDWVVKKRRPVRRKNIAPLLKDLENHLGADLAVDGAFLEMAQYGPWNLVLVDRVALAFETEKPDGERCVSLTLRGLLAKPIDRMYVEVDHGAIPFLMNGADCMVAGVHGADPDIEVDDLVWIRDKEHGRPLAIGWAKMTGKEMVESSKGKGISNIHHVGDELWTMEL